MRFIHAATAFAVIAWRAGRDQVRPNVLAPHVSRNNMIERQVHVPFAAILAGIIIAAKDLPAR